MTVTDRTAQIRQYATGAERLKSAIANVPIAAVRWRPSPEHWTVHEIVLHCADSEANAHMRLRYLLAEREPQIIGYDQDRWTQALDYHELPIEPALGVITAVRANTVPVLERLGALDWEKTGHHTENGRYSVGQWLDTYAPHLDQHAAQIGRVIAAWQRR